MKRIFRVISLLEGVSYLLLMSLGLYFKYVLQDDYFVKLFGMPHGVLFMAYILMAILIKNQMRWNIKTLVIVLLASVIPFGTFYIDRKYCQ